MASLDSGGKSNGNGGKSTASFAFAVHTQSVQINIRQFTANLSKLAFLSKRLTKNNFDLLS